MRGVSDIHEMLNHLIQEMLHGPDNSKLLANHLSYFCLGFLDKVKRNTGCELKHVVDYSYQ